MNEWMNEGQIHRWILKLTTGLLSAITKCGENFQQKTPFNYNIVINTCTLRIKRTKSACNDWSNTKKVILKKGVTFVGKLLIKNYLGMIDLLS